MVELASIIILGIAAQWIAWRVKVPAILPLILIGLLVGPIASLWNNGEKFIQPIFDEASNRGLFPGESLFYFVSLAIGVILFEGGLTLKRSEVRDVGSAILRLILLGALITFIGAGLLAKAFLPEISWEIAFLFGALIIVTGPTVIAPILQNIPLKHNVSAVLKWESILIDPVGALTAVLVFEFITTEHGGTEYTLETIKHILQVTINGVVIGALTAYGLYQMLKRDLIPHFLLNVFTLASVLMVFVLSDLMAAESGLVAVVVMGVVFGNLDTPRLKEILFFKESLSVLLISMLFIILAANIDIEDIQLLLDWRCWALFTIVVFVLRPISVFVSTWKSGMNLNEKLFISWMGPRGIVAAGIASLFGLQLLNKGEPYAEYVTPLVFMIVLGTVLINATTAKLIAKWLKVTQENVPGVLVVGANPVAVIISQYLKERGYRVVIADNSTNNLEKAKQEGLEAMHTNVFTEDLSDDIELVDMEYLIALTSNTEVNDFAIRKYSKIFGEKGVFRLIAPNEMRLDYQSLPKQGIFSYQDDFINLSEVIRDYPNIYEVAIHSKAHLYELLKIMQHNQKRAPLFIIENKGRLETIPYQLDDWKYEEGLKLVYLGKPLGTEDIAALENLETSVQSVTE